MPPPAKGNSSAPDASQRPPFLVLLRDRYSSLTRAERRAADHIIANPDRLLLTSIGEFANLGGVGTSTLTRLATKLGFAGYPDMKTALAVQLLNRDESSRESLTGDDSVEQVTEKILHQSIHNIEATLRLLDPREVARAAAAMIDGRDTHIFALGIGTIAMSDWLEYRLHIAGIRAAVHDRPVHIATTSELLGVGDVAIGISHTGEAAAVIEALRIARESGATTICLTNNAGSRIAEVAEIKLLAAAWPDRPMDDHPAASMAGMVATIDVIYAAVVLAKRGAAPVADPQT